MPTKISLQTDSGWDKAISYFSNLSAKLKPDFEAQLKSDGEFVIEKIHSHIRSQDLGWASLSPRTIELKGGDSTIYVETGQLSNSFEVKRVSVGDVSVYIGVADVKHNSGEDMIDIMGWLEYGTDKMPPRPLIEPTIKEVEPILKEHWLELFSKELSV